MESDIYIIYRDSIPWELLRGDMGWREFRLKSWEEMFPEFTWSMSSSGLDLLDQYDY